MKRFIVLLFTVILILIPVYLFAASCDSTEEGYYITFTFDGEEYTLSYGYTDVATGEAFGALFTRDGEEIHFYGINQEIESTDGPADNAIYVIAYLYPHELGVYLDDYDASRNSIQSFGEITIIAYDGKNLYEYSSSSGTISITSFGNVGEAIEGTFDLTFEGGLKPFAFGDSPEDVQGSFRVKRIAAEDVPIF